jgi:pimeloyl-ACP methyl ester carboxylesterase
LPRKRIFDPRFWIRAGWELTKPKGASTVLQPAPDALPQEWPRHLILVHGHNCMPSFMNGVQRALRAVPGAEKWHFWQVEYDTHWMPFTRAARQIVAKLREQEKHGYKFGEVILVGHSMGGVVARQMVVEGLPCHALFALGSPHLGYVPWLPFAEAGSLSISVLSRRLQILNRHPRDRAARPKYHFFACDYSDMLGYHAHDGLVTKRSALAEPLGPLGSRTEVHLKYRFPPGVDPHVKMLRQENLRDVLHICERVFNAD